MAEFAAMIAKNLVTPKAPTKGAFVQQNASEIYYKYNSQS
jgi:hypothetical protein